MPTRVAKRATSRAADRTSSTVLTFVVFVSFVVHFVRSDLPAFSRFRHWPVSGTILNRYTGIAMRRTKRNSHRIAFPEFPATRARVGRCKRACAPRGSPRHGVVHDVEPATDAVQD